MDEFALIRQFFDRPISDHLKDTTGVVVGIGDDGAVVRPTLELDQVQVIDTLVEGVHFPSGTNAADIAYRAVAVNLSDIAAMGAAPRWMTLALTLRNADATWLQDFATGLFTAADEFDVVLVGGDTTSGSEYVVTVSLVGEVARAAALRRSGAQVGDSIYVTGTLGDAGAGLQLLQDGHDDKFLSARFLRPTARVAIGQALLGRATAAIDISDGFIGDLGKLLDASEVGGEIELDRLPMSAAMLARFDRQTRVDFACNSGDDYELCFTAPAERVRELQGITAVGEVISEKSLRVRDNGEVVNTDNTGYRHFQ